MLTMVDVVTVGESPAAGWELYSILGQLLGFVGKKMMDSRF